MEHLDVLIVGAGLSGIDAAYWIGKDDTAPSWAIVESREAIGGTWDLFRYPGIRSDSDMVTLGFPFRPWRSDKSIVGGGEIRDYIRATAKEFGIDKKICFSHRVTRADWSSEAGHWTIAMETPAGPTSLTCSFLFMCSGYYDYEEGHAPSWPDMEQFGGRIVHPQFWPEDMAVDGKRVVVIGSGATAITLVPALVKKGTSHVTMLQRSPTYVVSRASRDETARKLRRKLPARLADLAVRWKNIAYTTMVYRTAKQKPELVRQKIAGAQRHLLGPDFDIARHLTPKYDPWDQRLCLVPDGDFFASLREGTSAIVTDQIERFTADGIALKSGSTLPADIIVTATGLKMKLLGGATVWVDGRQVETGSKLLYRGSMLDGVPNFAFAVGYTNASWTLKCDLTSQFVARLLRHMRRHGFSQVTPVAGEGVADAEPMLDLKSGYVQRAASIMPRQGKQAPWRAHQNYVRDLLEFKTARMNDGALKFERRREAA